MKDRPLGAISLKGNQGILSTLQLLIDPAGEKRAWVRLREADMARTG